MPDANLIETGVSDVNAIGRIGELKVSNHLLGDRAALDAAWQRDGYWYFKGILDLDVITQLRHEWIDYLQRQGFIDKGVLENRYNGESFEGKSITRADLERVAEFNERTMHRILTESPKICATLKEILGDDPFWLPIAEYRANAPLSEKSGSRFIAPHQDGFYSRGMDMKICWIPVDYIDRETGGCAWVEGANNGPILHDLNNPPLFPIPPEKIPDDGWKTADFSPGDIVIFDLNTPHSGLTNISKDRFRMSFDIRVTEASGRVPTIGGVKEINEVEVALVDRQNNKEKVYRINRETYVRGTDGKKREGAEIKTTFQAGETILVNSEDGITATLVRSIH